MRAAHGGGKISGGRYAPARAGARRIPARRAAARRRARRKSRGCMRKRKPRGSARRARAPRACRGAAFARGGGSGSSGGCRTSWRSCGRISRSCRSGSWRGAKSWRRWPSGSRARKPLSSGSSRKLTQAGERVESLRQQHAALAAGKNGARSVLRAACAASGRVCASEKLRLEEQKAALETGMGSGARARRRRSTKRCAASGNRSTNCAPSAASARSKRRATMRTAIICAKRASRN